MTNSVGANFLAVDFHMHTPGSDDYKDKTAQAADIIAAALAKNLHAIAVTDHNTVKWVDLVRDAAKDSGLVVFPGFEINAQGGHILGIFDPQTDIAHLETALIEAGISKIDFGNEEAVGKDIPAVLAAIDKNGGIAIGAHVDGPKGFLKTIDQGVTKEKYFKDSNLKAIEIINQESKDDFVSGKLYSHSIACVQGSDSHSLSTIGARFTYMKMEYLTLEGVRLVLAEPKLRIKFQTEYQPRNIPYIKSLHVSQGFLSGNTFEFNPGLNCLVGGAGSGKSTILEFIRFGLNQISSLEQITEDLYGKLRDLAGVGCDIIIELATDTGESIFVKRHYDGNDNPTYVYKLKGSVLDVNIADVFLIHAYSQGEAINIARNPLAQLELIDKHLADIGKFQDEINKAYDELDGQIDGLIRLDAKVKDKQTTETSVTTITERIKSLNDELMKLEEAKQSKVFLTHNLWIAEKSYLTTLVNSFLETKSEIVRAIGGMSLSSCQISVPDEETPNKFTLDECNALIKQLNDVQNQAQKLMLDKVNEIEKQIKLKGASWKEKYQTHDIEYQSLQVDQGTSRMVQINNEIEELRTKQQNVKAKLESIRKAEEAFKELNKKRDASLDLIKDRRQRIRVLRERKAKEFIKQIGNIISLHLVADGNKKDYERLVIEIFKGTYAHKGIQEKLYTSLDATELLDLIMKGSVESIAQKAEIDEKWASTLIDRVRAQPTFLYKLQTVRTEDLLEIGLRIAPGEYKQLDKLSSGQKATVVVLLTMADGKYPIIFDQPEDALYTPFIYSEVVKTLREGKDQRQFILATHNPNIAIGSDTDFSIIIDGSSNNTSVKATGGLDNGNTKALMLLHLEGGKKALLSRVEKFGIQGQLSE